MKRFLALAIVLPVPAVAQPAMPDVTRVEVAKGLVDVLMPPARREALLDGMMTGMRTNMLRSLEASPQFAATFGKDPRARAIFDRFFDSFAAERATALRAHFPDMLSAMSRAYARRFTVAQMGELRAFFSTPTGQVYMDQGATIMSDPDVAAWQQKVMAETFAVMPERVRALQAELLALPPLEKR